MANDANRWERLRTEAEAVVQRTLGALPADLRRQTARLVVCFERRPTRAMIEDGVDADVMGLFVGTTFEEEQAGGTELPGQILLFLEIIDEEAESNSVRFKREVRTTLLHELGHYLGLDEGELEVRGLE